MNGRTFFFQEFLRHPLQIGSVIPSSRFLEQRVVETARAKSARFVVELGPGTGGITRAVLAAGGRDFKLLTIEINPNFYAFIKNIGDDRLIPHLGDALQLKEIIGQYNLGPPDAIISGIPFSTMSHKCGSGIIQSVFDVLMPGGRFVAYQLSSRVISLCRPVMGEGEIVLEFLNIPPMRVCCWRTNNGNGGGPSAGAGAEGFSVSFSPCVAPRPGRRPCRPCKPVP